MDELLHELRDGIAYVTLNRPQARNALTFAMYERLAEICNQANEDRSIKAILITGGGDKAFAAGTDISQFRAFKTAQDALDYEARIERSAFAWSQISARRSYIAKVSALRACGRLKVTYATPSRTSCRSSSMRFRFRDFC